MLLESSLDGAVFAGHHLAVPVVGGSTRHAQIWVTLPHGQVTGALLRVALSLAPAAWEPVLTLVLTLAELLTKILGHDAGAGAVTRVVRVVAWLVVVHLIGRVIFLQLVFCP